MTIRSYLEKHASERSSKVALKYCVAKVWQQRTWAEFLAGVRLTAQAYGTKFELKPRKENVAIILPNSPTWLEVYLATSGAAVSVVPLDPKLQNDEVTYILRDSSAVVVTTDKAHLPMMKAIVPELPNLRAIVLVDVNNDATLCQPIGSVKVYDYNQLKQGVNVGDNAWYDQNKATEDDVASVIYTSGTTGKPKGAMLTHGNFIADIDGALKAFGERVDSRDSLLIVLPLFHAFSFLANFVLGMRCGCTLGFNRSLYTVGEDIQLLKPTIVMSVPLLAEKMFEKIEAKLKNKKFARWALKHNVFILRKIVSREIVKGLGGKLRFMIVGGAPCPHHVLAGYKRLGITVLEGYGLTECSPVVAIAGPKCAKIGSIGLKIDNIEIRLADANEQGEGELQVKGPITMKGYWHNEEATKEAFDGEWLKTGDLAKVDSKGLITICGRKKALIVNREGKNIYPEEVENRIAMNPIVADCVVVGYITGGIPGEKVGCIVHPNLDLIKEQNGGVELPWEQIEKMAQDLVHTQCHEVAEYKRVRKVVVSEKPLVRTSIQKVKRVVYQGKLNE